MGVRQQRASPFPLDHLLERSNEANPRSISTDLWQTLAVSSPVLTQCQTYTLKLINSTNSAGALGVPPYYISAFKASGHPTTSLLGSDPNNLTWTVNMASGECDLLERGRTIHRCVSHRIVIAADHHGFGRE